ncbi:MAG: nitroreductase [Fibrobacter sp.]|uniref:nitroreductase n=1 Tax=Fibrobacter sp. UWH4 TaxID=1896210 RepID=UPI0009109AD5|nr:nitroreductase [Fibrobacter sp. UWH4]MBO5532284.1 nitroreductase [Fibrobacter sp.]SHL80695.1 Nitroreductase [Fibrobacter sp. UWH4]
MNTLEAIKTRRSTRKFKARAVEMEKLQQIVEAGRFGPTGGNAQGNHFFVISNATALMMLKDMVQTAFAKMELRDDLYKSLKNSIMLSQKGNYSFSYNAPVLIVVANKKDYGNNMADVACAVENMMLAANELDLGSCYINQLKWLNEEPSIRGYLGTLGLKDDERVYASVAIGYADTESGLPNRTEAPRIGNEVVFV